MNTCNETALSVQLYKIHLCVCSRKVYSKYKKRIDDESYSTISLTDVVDALKHFKLWENYGNHGLTSDHLVYSSRRFLTVLSILMSSMLVHGYNAADLLSSTLISIPKNARGDLKLSENYRGIALCSSICKLIDTMQRLIVYQRSSIRFQSEPFLTL